MVGSDGVGNVLHQHGLTRFGLCHDEGTLSFTDRGEEIHHTGRLAVVIALAKLELLVGEEWGEELKSHTVTHTCWVATIDFLHTHKWEETLTLFRRTHETVHHITCLQTIMLDLLQRHIHIIGRWQVVVITAAKETVVVHCFQHTAYTDDVVEVVWLLLDSFLLADWLCHRNEIVERRFLIHGLSVILHLLSAIETVKHAHSRDV